MVGCLVHKVILPGLLLGAACFYANECFRIANIGNINFVAKFVINIARCRATNGLVVELHKGRVEAQARVEQRRFGIVCFGYFL